MTENNKTTLNETPMIGSFNPHNSLRLVCYQPPYKPGTLRLREKLTAKESQPL